MRQHTFHLLTRSTIILSKYHCDDTSPSSFLLLDTIRLQYLTMNFHHRLSNEERTENRTNERTNVFFSFRFSELFKLLFLVISICVLFIAFIAIIYGFYRWIRLNRFSSSMTDSVSEWKILAEESKV